MKEKEYYRRYRVCKLHASQPVVRTCGEDRRYCQQCSVFHAKDDFDGAKRCVFNPLAPLGSLLAAVSLGRYVLRVQDCINPEMRMSRDSPLVRGICLDWLVVLALSIGLVVYCAVLLCRQWCNLNKQIDGWLQNRDPHSNARTSDIIQQQLLKSPFRNVSSLKLK